MKEDTVLTTASSTPPSDAEVIERGETRRWAEVLAANPELGAFFDALSKDVAKLDGIVHALGIEGSTVEPVDAINALFTRISTLERELGASDAALMVLDELYAHADFRNGNTDQSGSMDEGSVLAGRLYDRAVPAIEAARYRVQHGKRCHPMKHRGRDSR